jgi:prevent-host-death family protein
MHTATVRDLRNRYSGLLNWIGSGEEVLITRRGKAIARLVPASEEPRVGADWSRSPIMESGRKTGKRLTAARSRELLRDAGGSW